MLAVAAAMLHLTPGAQPLEAQLLDLAWKVGLFLLTLSLLFAYDALSGAKRPANLEPIYMAGRLIAAAIIVTFA